MQVAEDLDRGWERQNSGVSMTLLDTDVFGRGVVLCEYLTSNEWWGLERLELL